MNEIVEVLADVANKAKEIQMEMQQLCDAFDARTRGLQSYGGTNLASRYSIKLKDAMQVGGGMTPENLSEEFADFLSSITVIVGFSSQIKAAISLADEIQVLRNKVVEIKNQVLSEQKKYAEMAKTADHNLSCSIRDEMDNHKKLAELFGTHIDYQDVYFKYEYFGKDKVNLRREFDKMVDSMLFYNEHLQELECHRNYLIARKRLYNEVKNRIWFMQNEIEEFQRENHVQRRACQAERSRELSRVISMIYSFDKASQKQIMSFFGGEGSYARRVYDWANTLV